MDVPRRLQLCRGGIPPAADSGVWCLRTAQREVRTRSAPPVPLSVLAWANTHKPARCCVGLQLERGLTAAAEQLQAEEQSNAALQLEVQAQEEQASTAQVRSAARLLFGSHISCSRMTGLLAGTPTQNGSHFLHLIARTREPHRSFKGDLAAAAGHLRRMEEGKAALEVQLQASRDETAAAQVRAAPLCVI